MSDYVVWLDSDRAEVFELKSSGVVKSHLKKAGVDHHPQNSKDHHDAKGTHFYHELAVHLKAANQLLILGPGLAKNHFRTHLDEHHKHDLAKKVIGLETTDHPTDNQILDTARRFFKNYDLFNNPIKPG